MDEPGPSSLYEERLYEHYEAEVRTMVARARRDARAFCELVLRDPRNRPIELSGCHIELHDHFDEHRLGCVSMHRSAGKSTLTAIGRSLFFLGRDPNRRIKMATSDDKMAVKRVRAVKGYIEQSTMLHRVFPDLRRNPRMRSGWTDHAIYVDREGIDLEPSLEGRGILSSTTGGRADILIGDDVCDFTNAIGSPAKRSSVKHSWFEVWMNMLSPDGRVWYIYTPWHQDDLSANLERLALNPGAEWETLRLGVEEVGDRLVPLWPEVWSEERLLQHRENIGPVAFARGYLLRAVDDSDCPLLQYVSQMVSPRPPSFLEEDDAARWPRIMAVDPAIAASEPQGRRKRRSSETVIFVVALAPDGTRWVDTEHSFRGDLSYPQTIRKIVDTWRATESIVVYVESNSYQQALVQGIRDLIPGAPVPVQGWNTGVQKRDERLGVPGMATQMLAGDWQIPFGPGEHPMDCECFACAFVQQVREWPVGEKDDAVMAWWIASHAARSVLGSVERPDVEDDDVPEPPRLLPPDPYAEDEFDPYAGIDDDYWR